MHSMTLSVDDIDAKMGVFCVHEMGCESSTFARHLCNLCCSWVCIIIAKGLCQSSFVVHGGLVSWAWVRCFIVVKRVLLKFVLSHENWQWSWWVLLKLYKAELEDEWRKYDKEYWKWKRVYESAYSLNYISI